ncbi:MAG: hypothetical protein NTX28_06375 [Novosphingobium sp.]|nr:hypothetical protein [Novosphingobium sp.]
MSANSNSAATFDVHPDAASLQGETVLGLARETKEPKMTQPNDGTAISTLPADIISDEATWDRCMRATDLFLSREYAHDPVLLAKHLVATLNCLTLDEVATLPPMKLAALSANAVKIVGQMVIHLSMIPGAPIGKVTGTNEGFRLPEKPPT